MSLVFLRLLLPEQCSHCSCKKTLGLYGSRAYKRFVDAGFGILIQNLQDNAIQAIHREL